MKRYRQQINVSNNVLRDKMHHMDNQKKQQLINKERNDQDTIDNEISTFGDNVEGINSSIKNPGRTQNGNWLDKHKLHLQMMK